MSFFGALFINALRANLASLRTWCLVLLLPLLTFGLARLAPAQEIAAPVQVGVVLPREGGWDFWRRLEGRSGLVVSFQAAGLEQARRQVALGRWDCTPAPPPTPLVRETVSACVAECISPAMAEGYLLDSGILTEAEAVQARPRLRESLLERDRVLAALAPAVRWSPVALYLRAGGGSWGDGLALAAGAAAVLALAWAAETKKKPAV